MTKGGDEEDDRKDESDTERAVNTQMYVFFNI